jgi:hypothetical protein
MNNKNETPNNSNQGSGDVIDFEKQKAPLIHERKEQKLKAIQKAFKKALPLSKKKPKRTKKKKGKK